MSINSSTARLTRPNLKRISSPNPLTAARLPDSIDLFWHRALSWRGRRAHIIVCAIVVLFTASFLGSVVFKGWIPHDDGTLAQSAHRILIGEIPHRDFDEGYTGGLSFLHAAAFRVLGENLVTLRIVFFTAVVLVTPVIYYIATRFAPPIVAGLLCVVSFAWSFPNYPASMPSWYNLILALCGCAALLRYLETGQRWWLVAGGFAGGLSVLVKIIGVYYIAGAALFLVFHVVVAPPPSRHSESRNGTMFAVLAGLVIALAPFGIMGGGMRPADVVEFALPITVIGICVVIVALERRGRSAAPRLSAIVSVAWPFAAGAVIPAASFVILYAHWHALIPLYRGVLVFPRIYAREVTFPRRPIAALLVPIPLIRAALSTRYSARELRSDHIVLIGIIQGAIVAWSAFNLSVFDVLWLSIAMAVPLATVAGAVLILSPGGLSVDGAIRRQQLFLLLAMGAWCALVQFPFSAPVYFGYVAPFVIVSLSALIAVRRTLAPRLAAAFLLAYAAIGFLVRPVLFRAEFPHTVIGSEPAARLDVPRGGIIVRREERDDYVRLLSLVAQHSRSRFIYVTPDAPEVYFLTERDNPTRTFFDLFDEPNGRNARVLAAISTNGVDVVVINSKPWFSDKISAILYDSLAQRFPQSEDVGTFEVRWRS